MTHAASDHRSGGTPRRVWVRRLEIVAVAIVGAVLGLLVAGSTTRDVGPFSATLSLRPALDGASVVDIPPLGSLRFATHHGPLALNVRVDRLKRVQAAAILSDPERLESLGSDVDHDVRRGLLVVVLRAVVVGVLGAAGLGFLAFRRRRAAVTCGALGLAVICVAGGVSAATFNRGALSEPRFTGLLAFAPSAVGDARDIAERFDAYSRQLGRLVRNVSTLYATTSTLPAFQADDSTIRVLHVSDLHLNPAALELIGTVVKQYGVDVVVDSGDLTDHGSPAEDAFADRIGSLGVPYIYVRGNHDSRQTEAAVQRQRGAVVLDGALREVAGLRVLGTGDPRFTPDKTNGDDDAPESLLLDAGEALARTVAADTQPPDLAVVHDPAMAKPLLGHVPLVLAGHTHRRSVSSVEGTTVMVEGSTGGAGLRALEGDEPTPVSMTVLYLDADSHRLEAYDEITVGGLGNSEVRLVRHVVDSAPAPKPSQSALGVPRGALPRQL